MAQVLNNIPFSIWDHAVPGVELQHSLPSQVKAIAPVIDRFMSFIRTYRPSDGSEVDIEIALCEGLTNAVVHGNREDPQKKVDVICRCEANGAVEITIRDQGNGFEWKTLPNPTLPENRTLTHGRGIYLMRQLMDEVWFGMGGTVLCLRKDPSSPGVSTPGTDRQD